MTREEVSDLTKCFPCSFPNKWDPDSVRWLKENGKLCTEHEKRADAMIAAAPKEPERKLVAKPAEKRFMPEPVAAPRSRYEREPGEDG